VRPAVSRAPLPGVLSVVDAGVQVLRANPVESIDAAMVDAIRSGPFLETAPRAPWPEIDPEIAAAKDAQEQAAGLGDDLSVARVDFNFARGLVMDGRIGEDDERRFFVARRVERMKGSPDFSLVEAVVRAQREYGALWQASAGGAGYVPPAVGRAVLNGVPRRCENPDCSACASLFGGGSYGGTD
jgi:hypothetical protein